LTGYHGSKVHRKQCKAVAEKVRKITAVTCCSTSPVTDFVNIETGVGISRQSQGRSKNSELEPKPRQRQTVAVAKWLDGGLIIVGFEQ